MNLTGDFVRRAAANVSSTVTSTVSSVASIGSANRGNSSPTNGHLALNAKEKYTMTLKCTPNKDAATMSSLSIKSGFMKKKNEQGMWEKRFICTVPHLFLYYYQSDSAEVPRGIIDLELFSNISRDSSNVITVAPTMEHEALRTFFFREEDQDSLNDWVSSLLRDRYFSVLEERNAYMQMQNDLTGVLDSAHTTHKSTEREKDGLEKQLADALLASHEAMNALQSVLVVMGVTEEEMSSLYDTNRVGQYLEQRVIDMRTQFESLSTRYAETIDAIESDRVHSLEEEIYSLKYAVELEREKNNHLESELVVARQEHRSEVEQLRSKMDILSTHFQLSVASRVLSEKKRVMATDQKRVLVKEVRGLRSRLDSSTDAVLQLMEANAKLSDAVRCLEGQVGDFKTNIDNLKALIAEHEGMRDLIITEQMMDESSAAAAAATTTTMEVVDVDGLLSSNEQVLESIRQASRCPPVEADNTAPLLITSPSSATVIDIDKVSLSHLRDLDWLDADQQRSVQERMNASSQHHTVSGEVQHVPPSSGGRDEGGDEDSRSSVASRDSSTATDPSSSSSVVGKSHYEDSIASSVASASAAVPSSSSRSIASTVSSKLSLFTGAVGYSLLSGTGGGTARSSMHSSSSSVTAEGVAAANHHHHHHHGDHYQGSSSTTSTISGGDVSSSILSSVVPMRLSSMFTMSAINSANSLTPSKIEPPISGGDSASSSDQKASPSSVGNADNSVDGMSSASDAAAIELSVTLALATEILSSSPTQLPPPSSSMSSSSSSSTSSDTKPSDPPSGTSGSVNESDRPSSSMRMVCLRCHGTVEGPKLSTCRCEEPAFSPEQLMTGISSAGSGSYGSESIKRSWGFASGVLFGVGSLVTSMTASSSSSPSSSSSTAVCASTSSSSVSTDPHTSSSSSHGAAGPSISSVPQINNSDAATDGPLLDDSGSMTLHEEDNNAIAQCAEYLDGDGNDDATASVCEDLSL